MKLCVFLSFLALPLLAQEPVRYEIRFPNAIHHEAEVRATFSAVRQTVLEVLMSRSSPGRYALHEFPKNVYNFKATDGQGHALDISQPSPYQWNVSGHKGTVIVEYTVFGDRADGTYAGIDTTHAHLNLPATLVWAHGFEKSPVSLKFDIPEGSGWKIATQLASHPDGTWSAPNMDRMMDSPVEISAHALIEWKTGNSQFRLALHHRGTDEEAAAFARLCQAITAEEEGVWGAFPQYDTGAYTFLIDYLPYVNGDGMEHRDSTVIAGTRDLRNSASGAIGTVAHEFFHSWDVKRIRPKSLEPFDFERANMSGELWFAEGFTSYYGPLVMKRSGLQSLERFVRSLGFTVSAVMTAPGRQVFNVIDMSRHAPFVDAATTRRTPPTRSSLITPTAKRSRWEPISRSAPNSPAKAWTIGCAPCGANTPIPTSPTPWTICRRPSVKSPARISRPSSSPTIFMARSRWITKHCWRAPESCCEKRPTLRSGPARRA